MTLGSRGLGLCRCLPRRESRGRGGLLVVGRRCRRRRSYRRQTLLLVRLGHHGRWLVLMLVRMVVCMKVVVSALYGMMGGREIVVALVEIDGHSKVTNKKRLRFFTNVFFNKTTFTNPVANP